MFPGSVSHDGVPSSPPPGIAELLVLVDSSSASSSMASGGTDSVCTPCKCKSSSYAKGSLFGGSVTATSCEVSFQSEVNFQFHFLEFGSLEERLYVAFQDFDVRLLQNLTKLL